MNEFALVKVISEKPFLLAEAYEGSNYTTFEPQR